MKKRISLPIAEVKPPKGWLKVEAKADHVRMTISGPIGNSIFDDSGTSSREFCDALATVDGSTPVHVHVNSEGGSVHQALEIYNTLIARGNVTTYVDGVALSAASIIALAGDTVISPPSSVWMIHSPRIGTFGDSEEHKRSLNMLDAFRSSMADVYAEQTGHDKDEILDLMDAESWFTGAEAVEFGLADAMDPAEVEAADNRAAMVLAIYRPPESVRKVLAGDMRFYDGFWHERVSATEFQKILSGGTPPSSKQTKQQTNEKVMAEKTTVVAAATNPAAQNDNPDLRRFIEERKARITASVKELAQGRIKNDKLDWWIAQAIAADNLAGEQAVYDQIEAMPMAAAAEGAALSRDAAGNMVDAALNAIAMPGSVGGTCYSKAVDRNGRIVEIGVAPERPRAPFAQEIRKLRSSGERVAALKRDWSGLLSYSMELDTKAAKAGNLPIAGNTFSSTLITDYLVDQSITILVNTWASLSCFTRDFSVDRYKPLATGQIKFVTAGATTLVGSKASNITNFEQGDSTTYPVSVPMSHYSQPFHVGQDELMSGLRLENLTSINLGVFANTLIKAALQPISGAGGVNSSGSLVAYSGTSVYSSSAGTFGWTKELPAIRAKLKKSPIKNIVLDGVFYSTAMNQPGFFQPTMAGSRDSGRVASFGWDRMEENTVWPAGFTAGRLAGFACNPQAIGLVAGLPQVQPNMPGNVLTETVITIPGPDISISNYMWFSLASRTLWSSYDVVFGAAGGDATAGVVILDDSAAAG